MSDRVKNPEHVPTNTPYRSYRESRVTANRFLKIHPEKKMTNAETLKSEHRNTRH